MIYDPALIIQKQKEDRIRKEKYREERNRLLKQRLLKAEAWKTSQLLFSSSDDLQVII